MNKKIKDLQTYFLNKFTTNIFSNTLNSKKLKNRNTSSTIQTMMNSKIRIIIELVKNEIRNITSNIDLL